MDWFGASGYDLARWVLQRGIATVYVIAFVSSARQFPALLGTHGLLPVPRYLARAGRPPGPTLFRWRYSDTLFRWLAWSGAALALAVVLGLPQRGPAWVPMAVFALLWLGYMSIVNVGQVFYGFGWEILLLEAGFLAAFLGSDETTTPVITLFAFRWLVFRLEFGAGMIKMRGDPAWRDLTALYYHHETQPMPNPLSWWFHHLPKPLHKVEVLGNHVAQLVVPFFLFAPQPVATVAAGIVIATQCWLVLSGNFAWLNVITIVLAFSAVATPTGAGTAAGGPGSPAWFVAVVLGMGALMLVLSWWPLRNLFSRNQIMNGSFNRWRLANAYGAFGTITRERYEVVVEGTNGDPDTGDWLEYGFHGKPGEPGRMPRQFAPYHLRLDWLLWFLALGSPGLNWFVPLLNKLLDADPATLRLLRHDPFAGTPPAWVRARIFSYRYSTWAQWRATGDWWVREPLGDFVPPFSASG
ncbi:hypothetical protein AL755_15925 [Arthrobacter sp. ERGS1:01]|uniref:lipase maturation factor family protein n=1 Tax=Arthrobacter sp. ERGS1:01 TaxID=1704044 RepID=UPI0006B673DA|nr:lipase maturation factor family protein [Arthrobacter sp. ERGS1:01]ALE06601.1 hypothetical protein AL755_15925 [Arthrobacter sp. ERGS1:01]